MTIHRALPSVIVDPGGAVHKLKGEHTNNKRGKVETHTSYMTTKQQVHLYPDQSRVTPKAESRYTDHVGESAGLWTD